MSGFKSCKNLARWFKTCKILARILQDINQGKKINQVTNVLENIFEANYCLLNKLQNRIQWKKISSDSKSRKSLARILQVLNSGKFICVTKSVSFWSGYFTMWSFECVEIVFGTVEKGLCWEHGSFYLVPRAQNVFQVNCYIRKRLYIWTWLHHLWNSRLYSNTHNAKEHHTKQKKAPHFKSTRKSPSNVSRIAYFVTTNKGISKGVWLIGELIKSVWCWVLIRFTAIYQQNRFNIELE